MEGRNKPLPESHCELLQAHPNPSLAVPALGLLIENLVAKRDSGRARPGQLRKVHGHHCAPHRGVQEHLQHRVSRQAVPVAGRQH